MDLSWQGGLADGVRVYSATDFQWGLVLPAASALGGTVAVLFLRETGCRNVWSSARRPAENGGAR